MIDRYSSPAMRDLWSRGSQIKRLFRAAQAAARVTDDQFNLGSRLYAACAMVSGELTDPLSEADMGPYLDRWAQLEARYDHDIVAFVELYRELLVAREPEVADWFHVGRTSSDLVDTALALGIRDSLELIERSRRELAFNLAGLAMDHATSHIRGRTHGQLAEYTTVGRRFAVILSELERTGARLDFTSAKLTGPVGVTAAGPAKDALRKLALVQVPSTQIVPRSHLATLMADIAAALVPVQDLASLIRLGAREEASSWVSEGRRGSEARGSSAMPGKRNPIRSERAAGYAGFVQSTAFAVITACGALWEERDISHSSVERVGIPTVLAGLEFLYRDMAGVVAYLEIHSHQLTDRPLLTPARCVSLLVAQGVDYPTAYREVELEGVQEVVRRHHLSHDDAVAYDPSTEDLLWEMVAFVGDAYE